MSNPFVTETLDQRIAALAPSSDLLLPEGAGPHPVVIQFHGCGGKKNHQPRWAEVARKAGWAAVVSDSYAHRRINRFEAYATVCTGLQLWGRERAGDLYAMVEWVRRQSWADPSRIVVAGWSHGAWTVLDALALHPGADAEKETRLAGFGLDFLTVHGDPYVVAAAVASSMKTDVSIPMPDGEARAFLFTPDAGEGPWPAILFYMDGPAIRPALFEMGERMAAAGYFVLLPDMFWRLGPYPPIDLAVAFGSPEGRKTFRETYFASTDPVRAMADTGVA